MDDLSSRAVMRNPTRSVGQQMDRIWTNCTGEGHDRWNATGRKKAGLRKNDDKVKIRRMAVDIRMEMAMEGLVTKEAVWEHLRVEHIAGIQSTKLIWTGTTS